jgi:uncharacterized membrane protein AbrB (regulator of aidB expression)
VQEMGVAAEVDSPIGAVACTPGGLAEMSLFALSLKTSVAFVFVHHLARLLPVIAGT